MADVSMHALNVAHGLLAAVVFAACFFLAGSLLIPRRWDEHLGGDESPALLGAAIYLLLCWFGVELNIAVKPVAAGFAAAVAAGSLLRHRWLAAALKARGVFSRSSLFWWCAFGLLYVVAYFYTMPPVGEEYLPLAWMGNIDLLTYIRYTRYLLALGPSNLEGFDYLNFVYLQTPGLFYLLGWFSMLFGGDPLSAAMPTQFALTALVGTIAARMAHAVFGLHRLAGLAIGGMLIVGPFFRYVAANYFLSTLMSTPVFLFLLWTTVSCRAARVADVPLMIRFGSAYVLLFLIYPFLLFAGIGAQMGALALLVISEMHETGSGARRDAWRNAGRVAAAASAPLAVLAAVLFDHLRWSFDMVTGLSQVGVAGWPLELISPLAVLGLPGVRGGGIQVEAPGLRPWAIAGYIGLALALAYLYFWAFRRKATPSQKTLVALVGGGILLYCAYYLRVGASYQQWKFATYAVLPLSFVICAAVARLVLDMRHPRWLPGTAAFVAALFVGGNLVVHARYDGPLVRLPAALRNVEQVDALPFFREMLLEVRGGHHLFGTYLGLYFLPSKRVHVVSDVFEPGGKLSFEPISKEHPLLVLGYGCEGMGHDDTMSIPGAGCLVMAPPSPQPDVSYPFNRSFLFIDPDYMTAREPGGRWNTRPEMSLRLFADPERAKIAEDAFVNLLVNPFLPPGVKPQRLVFSWGEAQRGETQVSDEAWISLPVRTADWSGRRSWALSISIAFPDGRTVLFRELSVSKTPRGRVVSPVR